MLRRCRRSSLLSCWSSLEEPWLNGKGEAAAEVHAPSNEKMIYSATGGAS
jgi:hypothetical protein